MAGSFLIVFEGEDIARADTPGRPFKMVFPVALWPSKRFSALLEQRARISSLPVGTGRQLVGPAGFAGGVAGGVAGAGLAGAGAGGAAAAGGCGGASARRFEISMRSRSIR